MKLLDTTFLIHYWAGKQPVREYLEAHKEHEFCTTTLNLKEIAVGQALRGELDRQEIAATFDWVTVRPFEREHAFAASELEATLHETAGVNQDKINALAADVLIAAVAKTENATVVTKSVADFEQFEGVAVETY